jgi:hypothetical protein
MALSAIVDAFFVAFQSLVLNLTLQKWHLPHLVDVAILQ